MKKHFTKTVLCAAMAALTLTAVPQMFTAGQNDGFVLTAEAAKKNYSGAYKVTCGFCLPSEDGCIAGGMYYHNFNQGDIVVLNKNGKVSYREYGVKKTYNCTGKMGCLLKMY